MINKLKDLIGYKYNPLNKVLINSNNLLHNYNYLLSIRDDVKVAPVIKSNAYGHGIVEVGRIVDKLNHPFICVDSIYEAYQLLEAGIKSQILVMGYVAPEALKMKKLPFALAVYTTEMLDAVKKYQSHAPIHIFVDTGIHREGVALSELPALARRAKELGLNVEGLMTHLAMASMITSDETINQINSFYDALKVLEEYGLSPKYQHVSATGGLISKEKAARLGNVVRTGVALYGLDPEYYDQNLRPALSFTSTVAQIKSLIKGEKVGYDFTFTAPNNLKIAVIPAGYNDGVDRRLSNKGVFTIGGVECPILGRVSMNITVVDVSNVASAKVGDSVTIYSDDREAPNSIENVAKLCGTIPYEILIHLHSSTKRVVV